MWRFNRMFIVLVLAALLLGACQPVMLPATTAAPAVPAGVPYTPRPDAPAYALPGPYTVGVRDFVIPEPGRPFTVTVWYPALNPEGRAQAITYALDFPTNQYPNFTIAGRALRDAAPDLSGGPYPLVVHSHGGWTFRQEAVYLEEHLASQGFVVMAAGHEDNWGMLFENFYRSEISRPQDISRAIDYAEDLTAADGGLAGLIDTEHVAVSGWSLGGQVAMEMAGARLNLVERQKNFCVTYPDDERCGFYATKLEEMAKLAGLDSVPQGLWPDWSDPRVDVIVPLEPAEGAFGVQPATVHTPVLMIEASEDLPGIGMAGVSSEHKTHVLLENAGHLIFMNNCTAQPGMAESGYAAICSDPVWDMDRAHDLVNHFVTAFLLAELKGDQEAAKALAPENVSFPGIQYQTTGITATATTAATLDEATVTQIEALVEKTMQENQIPGFALGIVKDGQVVYSKGFGVADVETRRPVTPQTVFLMYSLAKSLTAPAILQLVEEGKIDLDAPVAQYLPYFHLDDPRSGAITVRQVMNHIGGLPADYEWHFENLPRFWEEVQKNGNDAGTLERHLRGLAGEKLLYAPGETFSYANDGYNLLGAIIAQVSGQPYEEYMRDHVLQPFGMKNSTFLLQETDPALLAGAHLRDDSGQIVKSARFPYARWGAPSATLFSNLEDMLRWAQINLNRGRLGDTRIISEASYELMSEPYVEVGWGDSLQSYGYGWFKGDLGAHFVINNAGAGFGFRSYMGYAPDDGLAVVAMGNYTTDSATEPFYTLDSGVAVMKLLLGMQE